MAVYWANESQNTLKSHQTYPNMPQIPPTCIATSHMCHPHGLKIAQNRSKPLYGTIWHYMAHFGPFRTSNMTVYWANEGQNTLNTHIPKYAPDTTYMHCYQSHVSPTRPQNRSKSLKIAQNGHTGPTWPTGSTGPTPLYFRTSTRSSAFSFRNERKSWEELSCRFYVLRFSRSMGSSFRLRLQGGEGPPPP